MEKRKEVKKKIDSRLSLLFKQTTIQGETFFLNDQDVPFRVCTLEPDILVVEYGDTWEDGDCFYLGEMTEEEIYQAILHEVTDAEPGG